MENTNHTLCTNEVINNLKDKGRDPHRLGLVFFVDLSSDFFLSFYFLFHFLSPYFYLYSFVSTDEGPVQLHGSMSNYSVILSYDFPGPDFYETTPDLSRPNKSLPPFDPVHEPLPSSPTSLVSPTTLDHRSLYPGPFYPFPPRHSNDVVFLDHSSLFTGLSTVFPISGCHPESLPFTYPVVSWSLS